MTAAKNLLHLWRICQIPLHDSHVTAAAEQTGSIETQRLDAIRVIWLEATARVDDASTVDRYLEDLQHDN